MNQMNLIKGMLSSLVHSHANYQMIYQVLNACLKAKGNAAKNITLRCGLEYHDQLGNNVTLFTKELGEELLQLVYHKCWIF